MKQHGIKILVGVAMLVTILMIIAIAMLPIAAGASVGGVPAVPVKRTAPQNPALGYWPNGSQQTVVEAPSSAGNGSNSSAQPAPAPVQPGYQQESQDLALGSGQTGQLNKSVNGSVPGSGAVVPTTQESKEEGVLPVDGAASSGESSAGAVTSESRLPGAAPGTGGGSAGDSVGGEGSSKEQAIPLQESGPLGGQGTTGKSGPASDKEAVVTSAGTASGSAEKEGFVRKVLRAFFRLFRR